MTDQLFEAYNEFLEFERNFSAYTINNWAKEHSEVPVIAVGLYLVFVFQVPLVLTKPWNLRPLNAVWNLSLAIFSFLGAIRTVPYLVHHVRENGFVWTVCTSPHEWFGHGPTSLWMGLFALSKFPELIDTVFLVMQGKRVIFLHWFHHVTVLLYCWHGLHCAIATSLWFASINFSVHAIMYSYYFLGLIGLRKAIKPIAPYITAFQLLQMVGGIVVTVASMLEYNKNPETCHVNAPNFRLGLCMYFSYFVLFLVLFYDLYVGKKGKKKALVDTADASGHFRQGRDQQQDDKKKKRM